MGVLGVAALGTVGFGVYSANSSKNKKRRISYRSVPDEEELWLNVAKGILKGKKKNFFQYFPAIVLQTLWKRDHENI